MTRATALKRLAKLFGKRAYWRVENIISTPEKRATANVVANDLKKKYDDMKAARDAREKELLADPKYRELKAITNALYQAMNASRAESMSYKFSIGTTDGMFFHVEAQGDTWEECFDKLDQKAKAS